MVLNFAYYENTSSLHYFAKVIKFKDVIFTSLQWSRTSGLWTTLFTWGRDFLNIFDIITILLLLHVSPLRERQSFIRIKFIWFE